MEWTKEDSERLKRFRTVIDNDNTRNKEVIKEKLLQNRELIHVLNNKELEEAESEPDDYFGVNILPYYMVHPTQTNVQNFVCFETGFDEINRYNGAIKIGQIYFYILCEQKNLIDDETGLARHDLLGAIVMEQFNYTNYFGKKIKCVSDKASVVDGDYACRTLIFEQETPADIVRTTNAQARLYNKEVRV